MSDEINDGIGNLLTEFGGAKDRSQSFVTVDNTQDLDRTSLDTHYECDHYAAKVIDVVPEDCTKEGYAVKVSDSKNTNPFFEVFQQLGVVEALEQADKWARLYGGAAIILGAEDGQTFDKPLNMARVQSLDWLLAVDRYSLTASQVIEKDPRAPYKGFALPTSYSVQIAGSVDVDADLKDIHVSRIIRLFGDPVAFHRRAAYNYWAAPVLKRVFQSMANLMTAEAGISNLIQTYSQAIFKKKNLGKFVESKESRSKLIELFTVMNMSQSMLNMMIVDSDESFERQVINVAGLSDLHMQLASSYGAAANMPLTKIFGTTTGGLSSDDKSGTANYQARIDARNQSVYVPAIVRIAKILAASREFKDVSADAEISCAANASEGVTEQERAITFKTYAEAAVTLIDRGVLRPDEVRNSFFGSAGFTPDIVLDDDIDTTFEEDLAGETFDAATSKDANNDPPEKRAARRKVQTLVENGTLPDVKDCRCVDCGKQASEYDHVKDYKNAKNHDKVQAVCASCHHIRTNARGGK